MALVTRRRRHHPAPNSRAVGESEHTPGTLPSFSRSLGLDFIITPAGDPVLVELQHGFGRRGLISLFPGMARRYRKTYWDLRRRRGKCWVVSEGLRAICTDKIQTYKRFAGYQPSSCAYYRFNRKVERWLDGLDTPLILAKPPRGSCGRGIQVLRPEEFRHSRGVVTPALPYPALLQAYVESRRLAGPDGQDHIGCIRHIMIIDSDGQEVSFVHMPSYWRVSPRPFAGLEDRQGLTANISQGAFPLAVSRGDSAKVRPLAETIAAQLLREILELSELRTRPGKAITEI